MNNRNDNANSEVSYKQTPDKGAATSPSTMPVALPGTGFQKGRKELPSVDLERCHPSVKNAHQATISFVRAVATHSQPYWLTLYGVSGCGKTLLARHAHRYLKDNGYEAQMWPWQRAFARIMDGEYELIGHLARIPILILDDIGTVGLSGKAIEQNAAKLYEVLEARLDRKFTMLTSNLTPDDIGKQMDIRIASRLFRGNNMLVDMTKAFDYSFRNRQHTIV